MAKHKHVIVIHLGPVSWPGGSFVPTGPVVQYGTLPEGYEIEIRTDAVVLTEPPEPLPRWRRR